jgi:hypothetical protein
MPPMPPMPPRDLVNLGYLILPHPEFTNGPYGPRWVARILSFARLEGGPIIPDARLLLGSLRRLGWYDHWCADTLRQCPASLLWSIPAG